MAVPKPSPCAVPSSDGGAALPPSDTASELELQGQCGVRKGEVLTGLAAHAPLGDTGGEDWVYTGSRAALRSCARGELQVGCCGGWPESATLAGGGASDSTGGCNAAAGAKRMGVGLSKGGLPPSPALAAAALLLPPPAGGPGAGAPTAAAASTASLPVSLRGGVGSSRLSRASNAAWLYCCSQLWVVWPGSVAAVMDRPFPPVGGAVVSVRLQLVLLGMEGMPAGATGSTPPSAAGVQGGAAATACTRR